MRLFDDSWSGDHLANNKKQKQEARAYLVGLGLKTSKLGDLAAPLPKAYTGQLSHLAWPA